MLPTPPKSKKPQYRRPFYDAGKKTSAEIISEARTSVKPLDTSRPFTPVEPKRSLFGKNTARNAEGRPPSAVSIGPNSFSELGFRSASRPPTGKLTPLKSVSDSLEGILPQNLQTSPLKPTQPFESLSNLQESPPKFTNSEHAELKNTRKEDLVKRDSAKSKRRDSFPLPMRSIDPTMSRAQRPSSRHSAREERRVQSGPKEREPSRSENQMLSIKKYNSMGNIEREDNTDKVNDDNSTSSARSASFQSHDASSMPTSSTDSNVSNEIEVKSLKTSNVTDDYANINEDAIVNVRHNSSASEGDVDDQSAVFKDTIEPLLKQMELNYLHTDFAALSVNFDMLWKTLHFCNLLGKATSSGAARRRTIVLRTVFKFVDADSAEVILKLCKLALAMRVNGKNLVNICKLIFKISKDKTNDELFKEEKILGYVSEILRKADIIPFLDGIVYAAGSIKFLAANSVLHEELLAGDCVESFGSLLARIQELANTNAHAVQLSHLVVQASGAIRNLADVPNTHARFTRSGIIENLIKLLYTYYKDVDYMLNVSRILSKLTQYGDCCHIVYKTSSLPLLIDSLKRFYKRQDITVRLVFVLGNIAAKIEQSRNELNFKQNSLDVFMDILEEYQRMSLKTIEQKSTNESNEAIDKINEVLVKTVRMIANISIDPLVASDVANNQRFLSLLISVIDRKMWTPPEELLINCAATLNNLSYSADEESYLISQSKDIASALIQLLYINNMDCIIEVTRVFGNLTRFKSIRTLLRESKVLQMLITLLESSSREVVFCACGVLINLMVDNENRTILKDYSGVKKLIDAMKDFGQTDWQLSSMICQTLWNYSEKITSAISCFGEDETEELLQLLLEYLDHETAFDYKEELGIDAETKELMKQLWHEQFEQVGLRLLHRIEEHHTSLQPLVEEPD